VLRLPRPPAVVTETFAWVLEPPDGLTDLTWYLDGSMLHRELYEFRAMGFAVVVVSASRGLVGLGGGTPPWWCRTAAAAEAWALQVALAFCVMNDQIRTDCQSLVNTAEAGLTEAIAASRPLARIWTMIGQHTDGDIVSLAASKRLVWLPAHQTTAAIRNRWLANGQRFTVIDWRANRLADAYAKLVADSASPPKRSLNTAISGLKACKHAAAVLGLVTFAANNFEVTTVDDKGKVHTKSIRDAQAPAPAAKRSRNEPLQPPPRPAPALREQPAPAPREQATLWLEEPKHEAALRWRAVGAQHAKRLRLADEQFLQNRVADVASALSARPGPSGSTRLAELKLRVAARGSAG